MKSYGQYCPVARAAEILGKRWTLLILRDLHGGCRHFNQLRKGVPLISPSLLSRRLKELEAAGVVERRSGADGRAPEYHLTVAGAKRRPSSSCSASGASAGCATCWARTSSTRAS